MSDFQTVQSESVNLKNLRFKKYFIIFEEIYNGIQKVQGLNCSMISNNPAIMENNRKTRFTSDKNKNKS